MGMLASEWVTRKAGKIRLPSVAQEQSVLKFPIIAAYGRPRQDLQK